MVFLISDITSLPGMPINFGGLPYLLVLLLVKTGLPGVAITLTFGQLIGQIFVEEYTLQFMNLYGCEFVIRLSLAAEYIGVCNFSWLLYYIVRKTACKSVVQVQKAQRTMQSTDTLQLPDEPMSPTQKIRGPNFDVGIPILKKKLNWFDYLKYFWSTCVTLGSFVIIVYAIAMQTYVLPVNPVGAYIIAGLGLTLLFFLEGLMIAIVETQYWDRELFKDYYPRAYKLHELINRPENVKRFIIGRQFCTVLTNFLLSQVFTFAGFVNTGYNPVLFYIVIKSGLVGVFLTLAFGQLMPELLAAEFPLRFMDLYGSYSVGCLSLVFDAIGVGHCGKIHRFCTCICSGN